MFLEFWKRRRAELTYDWDLIDWEEEEVSWSYSVIDLQPFHPVLTMSNCVLVDS